MSWDFEEIWNESSYQALVILDENGCTLIQQPETQVTAKDFNNCQGYESAADAPPGRPVRRVSLDSQRATSASPTCVTRFLDLDTLARKIPECTLDIDSKRARRKNVRFLLDQNGSIATNDVSYSSYTLCNDDIRRCWYSRKDIRQMKCDIPLYSYECLQTLPTYRATALKVCCVASRGESNLPITKDFTKSLRIVTDGEARGLERSIFRRLNLPQTNCKRVVTALLNLQEAIRAISNESDTEDEIADLMAQQCISNSEYSKRWAILLAMGDEEESKEYGNFFL